MTRIAILSDIHSNREALAAVLEDAARRQADRFVILGDIVGYGPDPAWCCDKVQALAALGALVVRGNHDAAIARPDGAMSLNARLAIDWTRPRLNAAQQAWLAGLPLLIPEGDLLFSHAGAHNPGDWMYVTSAERAVASFRATPARVIFCGHTHVPRLFSLDVTARSQEQTCTSGAPVPLLRTRRWLAVVGSVGQPRDRSPQAGWVMLDTRRNELTFHRTPYDVAATVAKVRAAGLPEALAVRLLTGA